MKNHLNEKKQKKYFGDTYLKSYQGIFKKLHLED